MQEQKRKEKNETKQKFNFNNIEFNDTFTLGQSIL